MIKHLPHQVQPRARARTGIQISDNSNILD
jgi:hypothetical protein